MKNFSRRRFVKETSKLLLLASAPSFLEACGSSLPEMPTMEEPLGKITGHVTGPALDLDNRVIIGERGEITYKKLPEARVVVKYGAFEKEEETNPEGFYSIGSIPTGQEMTVTAYPPEGSEYARLPRRIENQIILMPKNPPEITCDIPLDLNGEHYPTIYAKIRNSEGEGIWGAEMILIQDGSPNNQYSFSSDEEGEITEKIYPGNYRVTIMAGLSRLLEDKVNLGWQEKWEKECVFNR